MGSVGPGPRRGIRGAPADGRPPFSDLCGAFGLLVRRWSSHSLLPLVFGPILSERTWEAGAPGRSSDFPGLYDPFRRNVYSVKGLQVVLRPTVNSQWVELL